VALNVANEFKILKTSDEQVFSKVNSVLDGVIYFSNGVFECTNIPFTYQSRTQSMPIRRLGAGHDSGETE
jgi:hypothetical protein